MIVSTAPRPQSMDPDWCEYTGSTSAWRSLFAFEHPPVRAEKNEVA
jgi:hypothetical protein